MKNLNFELEHITITYRNIQIEDEGDMSVNLGIEYSDMTFWRAKDYVNFIVKDVARPDLPDQVIWFLQPPPAAECQF